MDIKRPANFKNDHYSEDISNFVRYINKIEIEKNRRYRKLYPDPPMPYRRRRVTTRRRPSRRNRRRTYGNRRRRTMRNRRPLLMYTGPQNSPLPDYYMTKLHYNDWVNIPSTGIIGIADSIISGNGAYDPYVGLGGIGCAGFAELAAIYTQYRVYASKITVVMKAITDVTATGDFIAGLIPDRSGSGYSMSLFIGRQASLMLRLRW